MAIVKIPTPLRVTTSGLDTVQGNGDDLVSVIEDLESQFPGMKERLLDENNELRRFVNIFVNGEDVRFLEGLNTTVTASDEISIVPAVAGG
ncbi:MAG: MoaD family protein [Dehalococcoidia bacterium]|jgi:molybdopterin synthase sulfur carrier subunit|nr:MoaD family protein [Dehalococcoidia bacterium]